MTQICDVEAFYTIVRHGTISAAARQLDLAPVSVRRRLERLETVLEVPLLHRHQRSIGLTEEGKLLYNYLIGVFEGLDHALGVVARGEDGSAGRLRVASNLPAPFRSHLKGVVCAFARQHPQVEVNLDLTDTDIDLVYGGYDMAITSAPPENTAGLTVRPLATAWCLCATPEYVARHPAIRVPLDLHEHDCLLLEAPGALGSAWTFFSDAHTESIHIAHSMATDNPRVLREWLLAGMGIAAYCEMEIRADLAAGRLVRILPHYQMPEIRFYILYDRIRQLPARTLQFKDFVTRSVASDGSLAVR
ncbi:LysR family transcriptional regulator [Alcanivorax quisquiliarum]|uniref:LysR family transcriptional regulator n=1 Tax=Alcanivorax quisquiliarum TaxID=2933565 RepID=A0ABT0EAE9_9GAMM|nr:LysR family transcriptional regulator [Alcanivorax quisquiliarum]MCK0538587.1 LysR family transcriptional regulator [Alcanivorax quisquiliarum]